MTLSAAPPLAARRGNGVALILLAMLAFAVQDVVVKIVAEEVSIWQLQAVRSSAVITLVVAGAVFAGRVWTLEPGTLGWPLIRTSFMAAAYLLFYASLPVLALSQAAATFFVGPLLITLLGALVLGEQIGPKRMGAIALGFVGVLMIVRPWDSAWQPAALLPVAAACCYAMGVIVTRWRCKDRSVVGLTLMHNLVFVGIGLVALVAVPFLPVPATARADWPFLLTGWQTLEVVPLILILSTSVSHLIGMIASSRAYQRHEAGSLAPFEYFYLAIIPLFDIAVWGIVPGHWTLAGMLLIALGGSIVARAEGRRARPTAQPAGSPPPWTVPEDAGKKDG